MRRQSKLAVLTGSMPKLATGSGSKKLLKQQAGG
jgi:hypothetical protein